MKKIIALLSVFVLCASMTACGGSGKKTAVSTPTPKPSPTATPAPTATPTVRPTLMPTVAPVTTAPKRDNVAATLRDVDNIGDRFSDVGTDGLIDNYGNSYSYALSASYGVMDFETLLDGKYTKFGCVLYTPKGCNTDGTAKVLIKLDGKVVYTSPDISKTSHPVEVNLDITGCNDFQIEVNNGRYLGYIANAEFTK